MEDIRNLVANLLFTGWQGNFNPNQNKECPLPLPPCKKKKENSQPGNIKEEVIAKIVALIGCQQQRIGQSVASPPL